MKPDSTDIQKRYDRLAPYFDLIEAPMEGFFFRKWRKRLWGEAEGYHILEVGVGTGKNFDFYPANARVTAVDFSTKMLQQAERTRGRKKVEADLEWMDVQSLSYADNSFDTVIGSFVFCSVPMPVKGLKELNRVCRPGGKVVLLEHVVSAKPALADVMKRLNPLVLRTFGANIDRDTVKNVKLGGFTSVRLHQASGDILKLIIARK